MTNHLNLKNSNFSINTAAPNPTFEQNFIFLFFLKENKHWKGLSQSLTAFPQAWPELRGCEVIWDPNHRQVALFSPGLCAEQSVHPPLLKYQTQPHFTQILQLSRFFWENSNSNFFSYFNFFSNLENFVEKVKLWFFLGLGFLHRPA